MPDAAERLDDYPHQFSGGMRQRIMIAMALLLEPALLVADEPTSALDVTLEAQIVELLRRLRESHGTAILFVSHDLGVISQLCDRVVVMYAGRAVEQGAVEQIFSAPRHPYTQALLAAVPSARHRGERLATIPGRVPSLSALPPGCAFHPRCPHAQDVCERDVPRDLPLPDGGRVQCHIYDEASAYRREQFASDGVVTARAVAARTASAVGADTSTPAAPVSGEALVRIESLRTYFDDSSGLLARLTGARRPPVRAVDDVDLELRRGEVVGLVGESGSGKTTLGRAILGLAPATGGRIVFDGQDVAGLSRRRLRQLRRRAQMIFQDPYSSLSPRLRVSYLLTEPYRINRMSTGQHSVDELLAMVELSSEQASKYPHELSGGQARRVGIARALALSPDFLVADEPTSGLDVSAAAAILNLMKDLGRDLGLTYLVITHNLGVVGYIADRIAVMYLGQIVEIGPGERVLRAPAHPYTVGLLSAVSEPDPSRAGAGTACCCPARSRALAIRRRPAASTRAARSPPRSAASGAAARADRARPRRRVPPLAARARVGGGLDERHRRGRAIDARTHRLPAPGTHDPEYLDHPRRRHAPGGAHLAARGRRGRPRAGDPRVHPVSQGRRHGARATRSCIPGSPATATRRCASTSAARATRTA